MDFGEVLTRAWQIIWKHKVLWIFGILVSCTQANPSANFGSNTSWQTNEIPYQVERTINSVPDWQIWAFIAIIFLVVLFLIVLAIFLGTIGRIGLIRGTVQAEDGAEKLTFGELFSGSMPYFWRVFLLNLLIGIGVFIVFAVVIGIVVVGGILSFGIGLICLIPLLCLLLPFAWIVSVVIEQANNAIVVEELGIMDGLSRGWDVVRLNAGSMIVMWLILELGIGLIVGLIIALPLLFTLGPIIAGLIAGGERAILGGLAIAGICFVAYLPFLIVLSGIMRSYIGSAWTLTFLRLTAAPDLLDRDALDLEPPDEEPLEPLPEAI